jgi:hydrogenase-4 component B
MLKTFRTFLLGSLNTLAISLYLFLGYKFFSFFVWNKNFQLILFENSHLKFINLSFRFDHLSLFFAFLIVLISAIVSIYSIQYSKKYKQDYSLIKLSILGHLFSLSMLGLVLSDHVFSFLFFWELMSFSSYLLVIYDYRKKENLRAGFVYFLMTHLAGSFLLAAFLLLGQGCDSLSFSSLYHLTLSPNLVMLVFFMFLIASLIKAGSVPFHFWLPLAHPAAPSHISALMSALMVKMPIYLMIKVVFCFLSPKTYIGYSILFFGLLSGLFGIIFTIKENDIKKLLAYSTIENVGIILISLGLSVIFASYTNELLSSMSMFACIFHIFNHSIYKSSLFLGAGSILSETHTSSLNKLGGLIKKMPQTAFFFLISVLSIISVPYFNGFISEWILYQSIIHGIQIPSDSLAIVLPLTLMCLAIITGLAFVSFSKLFTTTFLGSAHSLESEQAQEVSTWMWLPTGLLSFFCLSVGVFPHLISKFLFKVLDELGMPAPETLTYFTSLDQSFPTSASMIILLSVLGSVILVLLGFRSKVRKSIAWTCGYEVNKNCQYNSSSFSQASIRSLKTFYKISFDKFFIQINLSFNAFCKDLRDKIQSGSLHAYLLYILLAVIMGLIYAKYF